MKLALGTAQFGLDYGITNQDGKIANAEVQKIINTAIDAEISLFDTASAYGDSEAVLGQLTQTPAKTQFISKITISPENSFTIAQLVQLSLNKLRCRSLYGMLFHNEKELLAPQGAVAYGQLMDLKEQGKLQKIGASFYSLQALEAALAQYELDIIQIPASALDQRFQQSGLLQKAQKQNVEVHARSLFLQGLLLTPDISLPPALQKFHPQLALFFATAKKLNLTPLQLALTYLLKTEEINYGVVGCQNSQQLLGIINAYNDMQTKAVNIDLSSLSVTDEHLVNPSLW